MELLWVLAGLVAAGLTLLGGTIYVRAVWRRTSSTRWSSWMIWTITSVTSLATYYGSGARESAWVPVAYVVVCGSIFIVALLRRSPGGLTNIEYLCLFGAGLSGAVWWVSGSAIYGQLASVAIEVIAYVPIWMAARHEHRLAWSLETAGSVVNLLAISQLTLGLVLYPVALLASNGLVLGLIVWHSRQKHLEPALAA